jgi:hypothetical protein
MLVEFLQVNRTEVFESSDRKTKLFAPLGLMSDQLNEFLHAFYEQLITLLGEPFSVAPPVAMLKTAVAYGKEFLKLEYPLSHIIHSYGSMCQVITEMSINKNLTFSSKEFDVLNNCFDMAMASAVSGYQFRGNDEPEEKDIKRLGFLAQDLQGAIANASQALEMLKFRLVGIGKSSVMVLPRMHHLIDRALSEARIGKDPEIQIEKFWLSDLVNQIVATAQIEATKKNQAILTDVDWRIVIEADRQFILSALARLIHHAIDRTKPRGRIYVNANAWGPRVSIEIKDESGGGTGPNPTLESPALRDAALGLAIAQRAIRLSQGTLKIEDSPGKGMVYNIDIPLAIAR